MQEDRAFSEQAQDMAWVGGLDCSLSRRPMLLSKRKSRTPNNQIGLEVINSRISSLLPVGTS
jgi:hypothetical protein